MMKKATKYYQAISGIGAALLLTGAMLNITRMAWAPYMYLCGSILFAYVQAMCGYEGKNIVIKRLRRQQIVGDILLVVTGVMMLFLHHNEWIACLTIAAVLELYTAFRIPQEEEKEQK